jgi:hypothetical protein
MKRVISIVLVGAAITTAALAFANRQGPAKADAACGACMPCCNDKSDT